MVIYKEKEWETTMLITKIRKVAVACAATLGLVATGIAGASAADSNVAPWDKGAPATGSITIEKAKDGEPTAKVAGAEFTVKQVNKINNKPVTLNTMAGWHELAKNVDNLNNGTMTDSQLELGNPEKKQTGTDGVAKFENKAVGLYQVAESKVPSGYSSEVKTFYVTIPQINGTAQKTTTFDYNVVVKPKNKDLTSKVTKVADTSALVGAGDTIGYTITADLNKTKDSNGGNELTKDDIVGFNVFDDALKTAYDNASKPAAVTKVTVEGTDLTKDTDYSVSVADTPGDDTRSRIKVEFTDKGLEKIVAQANMEANKSKAVKIAVKLDFVVAKTAPGSVINKYGFTPGHGTGETPSGPVTPGDNKPGGPTPNPETKFLKMKIKKVSAKNGTAIRGAKFKLFANEQEAIKCAADPSGDNCKAASALGDLVSGEDGFTAEVLVKSEDRFYAVETEAPDDYVRATQPEEVNANTVNKRGFFEFKVENVAKADSTFWFNLPKTGAFGVGLFALIGLGLVGGGTAMFVRSSKSRKEN
ncbi:SpaH/EbpB family LPXTG-anchored major pilin [Actinotignum sp. GS-2025b]|uniref:SpaH/EbpB family LPXTG-anchored major pilin n=1 Tax=Actinotignum sp. GS-2025b TaxID=3427275 RepID=UPI003F44F79E